MCVSGCSESGHAVWAFDDLNDFYDPQLKRGNLRDIQSLARPFEFVQGDLLDRATLDELCASVKFDQIIHWRRGQACGQALNPLPCISG